MILTPTFTPLSYQEIVQPYKDYQERYDKVEDEYTKLLSQAEAFRDKANREKSPEAYRLYQTYMNDLQRLSADLAENGLTAFNKKELSTMRGRYSSEITPIANAEAARKEAMEFREKMGADAIFQVQGYDSLDSFLQGKQANNNFVSAKTLEQEAALRATGLLQNNPAQPEIIGRDNGLLQVKKHSSSGTPRDLKAAMESFGSTNESLKGNPYYETIQNMLQEYNYDAYDEAGKRAIRAAISTGLETTLDKPEYSLMQDPDHITPYQQWTMDRVDRQDAIKVLNGRSADSSKGSGTSAERELKIESYYDPEGKLVSKTDEPKIIQGQRAVSVKKGTNERGVYITFLYKAKKYKLQTYKDDNSDRILVSCELGSTESQSDQPTQKELQNLKDNTSISSLYSQLNETLNSNGQKVVHINTDDKDQKGSYLSTYTTTTKYNDNASESDEEISLANINFDTDDDGD